MLDISSMSQVIKVRNGAIYLGDGFTFMFKWWLFFDGIVVVWKDSFGVLYIFGIIMISLFVTGLFGFWFWMDDCLLLFFCWLAKDGVWHLRS